MLIKLDEPTIERPDAPTDPVKKFQGKSAEYLAYLNRELDLRAPFIADDSEVVQIQLGGGTPTFFLPSELEELGRN